LFGQEKQASDLSFSQYYSDSPIFIDTMVSARLREILLMVILQPSNNRRYCELVKSAAEAFIKTLSSLFQLRREYPRGNNVLFSLMITDKA
jgi:hypothetical protein